VISVPLPELEDEVLLEVELDVLLPVLEEVLELVLVDVLLEVELLVLLVELEPPLMVPAEAVNVTLSNPAPSSRRSMRSV
jgi:hypothetical protein